MKKLLFLPIIAIFTITANAEQSRAVEMHVGLHFSEGGKFSDRDIGANFTIGGRVTDQLFIGGGLGISSKSIMGTSGFYRIKYSVLGVETRREVSADDNYIFAPLYVRLKFDFVPRANTFFVMFDAGYNIGNGSTEVVNTSGFFFRPSVGYRFRGFSLNLGMDIAQNQNLLTWGLEDGTFVKAAIGLNFRF